MSDAYTILCVDDEESILKSLERLLRCEGYKILSAISGKEGLALLEKEHVDLVISDQRMPEMNGSEFLRIVKDEYPQVTRIMLSGYSDFSNLISAINEGEIFRFLTKPWETEELLRVVKTSLEKNLTIKLVEDAIKKVCNMVQIAEFVSSDTSDNQRYINVKIGNQDKGLSPETINNFLKLIFTSLGEEGKKYVNMSSGNITKKEGAIIIAVNIGKGLTLKIESPSGFESVEGSD